MWGIDLHAVLRGEWSLRENRDIRVEELV